MSQLKKPNFRAQFLVLPMALQIRGQADVLAANLALCILRRIWVNASPDKNAIGEQIARGKSLQEILGF